MSIFMSLFVAGASAVAACRIYKSYQKDKRLREYRAQIAEEEFQEKLRRNRLPKLERGVFADVVMRVHPEDREHIWDSNLTRWSQLDLQSSWGFYGTGPHVMAEDILYHFTSSPRFSHWGEPVRAVVEELVCFVPLNGGTIKCEQIQAIVARYWDKFEAEVDAMNRSRNTSGLYVRDYVIKSARPSYLEPAPKSTQVENHPCS
jgi:hypothetical protein